MEPVQPRRLLQFITLIVALVATMATTGHYCCTLGGKCRKELIAPVLFFLHVAIFYACVFLDVAGVIDLTFFTSWSAGVTAHSVITVAVMAYIVYRQGKWLIG